MKDVLVIGLGFWFLSLLVCVNLGKQLGETV